MNALLAAVECGDAKRVEELLAQIPQVDQSKKDYRKRTALHLAVEHGHEEVVAALIRFGGIDLAARDCAGFTALHLACELGHDNIVARLLEANSKLLGSKAFINLTCLHLAAIKGHLAIVKQLLAINLDPINMATNTAFDPVFEYGNEGNNKRTALDFAVEYGHEEIVSLLVETVQSTNDDARYAKDMFHNAVTRGYEVIVDQILARRPQLFATTDAKGKTALQLAAEKGHRSIVHQLFASKPDLTEVGGICRTNLLHFMASYGYDTIVARLLVEKPHLIDETNKWGATVLHVAAFGGHEKVVAQLLSVKPALASVTDMIHQETPLHYAAKKGRAECVAPLLIPNPELIDVVNTKQMTPLNLAVCERHHRAAACLLAHGATRGVNGGMLLQVLCDAEDEASDEVATLILDRQPELVRTVGDDGTTVLHQVFGERRESQSGGLFTEELMLKCWQMFPEAVHMTDDEKDTPFQIAIYNDNKFAIELVQWRLSLDEIVSSYAKCEEGCPQSILDQLGECLSHSLNKDVIREVYEYFFAKPKKNKRKRDSDGDASESEDK